MINCQLYTLKMYWFIVSIAIEIVELCNRRKTETMEFSKRESFTLFVFGLV